MPRSSRAIATRTGRARRAAFGAVLLVVIGSACASRPTEPGPIAITPTISFAEGRLGYRGRRIDFPASLDSVIELFGPPSRSTEGDNTIDTWDELGVYAYRKPGESLVHELNVSLSRQGNSFSPQARFTGRVEVPGGFIDLDSTPAELKAAGLRQTNHLARYWNEKLGRYSIGATWDEEVVDVYLAWRGPAPQHVTGAPLPDDQLFTAEARAYDFPFDETVLEVRRRGNVSVLKIVGASSQGSVGRSFFVAGAVGELARRRGFAYVVFLNDGFSGGDGRDEDIGPGRLLVGLTNAEEPDVAREFPDDYVAGREYDTMPADFILEILPNWPDGGVPAAPESASGGGP